MSRRPQILAGCLRLLACGPETTRDLALHVGTTRALVAVALHGEPGVTREGDVWSLSPFAIIEDAPKRQEVEEAIRLVRGKPESKAIAYLRENPGWHNYAEVADRCGLTYASVAQSVMRNQASLKFCKDEARRVLVMWKGTTVPA
jgi:hypothetical protein